MEKEDQFDKETGFDLVVSETGVSVKTKSRIVSAADRWCGNWFRKKSFKGERAVQTDEQLITLEAQIVQKAGEKLLKRVDEDDDFALEVLNIAYSREARRRDNKEGVILAALEILKNEAVSENESLEGSETLSDEFLDRVERYVEDASTEELRERWGRVLAGEIRKPGTFNKKVLRAIDELDSDVAKLFEELSACGFGNILFRSLVRSTSYTERVKLFGAGIFTSTADDQLRAFSKMTQSDGEEVWCFIIGEYGVGFRTDLEINYTNEIGLKNNNEEPCFTTYLLSDVGEALLKLINNDEREVAKFVFEKLKSVIPEESLYLYQMDHRSGYAKRIYDF